MTTQFVELAFERADPALLVTDTTGRALHTNEAFRELLGWSVEDGIDMRAMVTRRITRPERRTVRQRLPADPTSDDHRGVCGAIR